MNNKKRKPRGKTKRFVLNEQFIFGAPRCLRCGRLLESGLSFICEVCKSS